MKRIFCGLFVLFLGIASVAAADPIILSSGTIFLYPPGDKGSFDLQGPGLSAGGSGTGSDFATAFHAGQTVDLSRSIMFHPDWNDGSSGMIDGQMYVDDLVSGVFQLAATPFIAGSFSGDHQFTTPFTLTGLIQVFARPGDGPPLFSQEVAGSGVASFTATNTGDGSYVATRSGLLLTIRPGATATPEPASLLLLGSGLVAAWRSRKIRRED